MKEISITDQIKNQAEKMNVSPDVLIKNLGIDKDMTEQYGTIEDAKELLLNTSDEENHNPVGVA